MTRRPGAFGGLAAIVLLASAAVSQTTPPAAPPRGAAVDQQTVPARQTNPARGTPARRGTPAAGRGAVLNNQAAKAKQAATEKAVREGLAKVVRDRLGLNDDQMAVVGRADSVHAAKMALIDQQERTVRMRLQNALLDPNLPKAKQDTIQLYTTRLQVNFLQARAKANRDELTDLSTVLTPAQTARLLGIREQVQFLVDSVNAATPPDSGRAVQGRRGGGSRP